MKYLILILFLSSCASTPPEFLTAMEKEQEGIVLLKARHNQTVQDLTSNWYEERVARIENIKQQELTKITFLVEGDEVVKRAQVDKLDSQFKVGIKQASDIRELLLAGYADTDNWDKLVKLHTINLNMARSLVELNQAQRAFYSDLVGKNVPFPTDFINDETKKLLGQ